MIKTTLLCLVLVSFSICCSSSRNVAVKREKLKEITTTVDVQFEKICSVELPQFTSASLHMSHGALYIIGQSSENNRAVCLNILDRNLQLILKKNFTYGQGPGELSTDAFFYRSGDNFYTFDNAQQRISIFDKDLDFIRFIKARKFYQSPLLKEDGQYFVAARLKDAWSESALLIGADIVSVKIPGLEEKKLHTLPMTKKMETVDGVRKAFIGSFNSPHYFVKEDSVYILDMKDYILSRVRFDGSVVRSVRLEIPKQPVPSDKGIRKKWKEELYPVRMRPMMHFSQYIVPASWMVPLGKGFAVVRRNGYGQQCNGLAEADYFNYDLQMLGKIQIPCFTEIFNLRQLVFLRLTEYFDGHLYLSKTEVNDNDVEIINIQKWKVKE